MHHPSRRIMRCMDAVIDIKWCYSRRARLRTDTAVRLHVLVSMGQTIELPLVLHAGLPRRGLDHIPFQIHLAPREAAFFHFNSDHLNSVLGYGWNPTFLLVQNAVWRASISETWSAVSGHSDLRDSLPGDHRQLRRLTLQ